MTNHLNIIYALSGIKHQWSRFGDTDHAIMMTHTKVDDYI